MTTPPLPQAAIGGTEQQKPNSCALLRWDNEGGSIQSSENIQPQTPAAFSGEITRLHTRVIALENLVVALLAQTSSAQRGHVRDMAAYITPREGFTAHLLTTEAAARMRHLIERSDHFSSPASRATPGDGDTS